MTKPLLKLFAALGAVSLIGAIAAIGVLYAGLINAGADTPHQALVFSAIEHARERSIARQARRLAVPGDLTDPERMRRGAGNYDAMCAGCHLSPGAANSEIRQGLYPTPLDLTQRVSDGPDTDIVSARRFWIIKHGIKASGMPAWAKGGMDDDAIWDLAALLERLPDLSAAQYRALVASSDGHVHQGMDDARHDEAMPTHAHKPGSKPHSHN